MRQPEKRETREATPRDMAIIGAVVLCGLAFFAGAIWLIERILGTNVVF